MIMNTLSYKTGPVDLEQGDGLGKYLVTVWKVDRRDGISEVDNVVVGVGVAPTISALRFPEEQPATRLRPSPTTTNETIAQGTEKSSSLFDNITFENAAFD